jgi:hypothetical protein
MHCVPAPTRPAASEGIQPSLTVTVLFTDVLNTLNSLCHAATLSGNLNASLRILAPVVVPYPLALTQAPVNKRYLERRLTTVANGARVPTRIDIVYCRDRVQGIEQCLEPHSIVIIGWRKRWPWDTTARLVKRLIKSGHHVITAAAREGD